ncbi:S-ribosylhomocysteine lyase [Floccifex sp.]|uniref:S-ribosylhomocysteine lyase n=1 Tax=Floccifex sp. TaxID=2815810 RepID=UPI003F018137
MKREDVQIESFTLDHTKVKAPYVRLISQEKGPKGDIVSNYDIRLTQPNEMFIPTAGMHTLEHLLALTLRPRLEGYLDCSPFGCRTGFHLLTFSSHSSHEVALALKSALEEIVNDIEWEDVPGTKEKECGNYRDHSLFCAKEYAKRVLQQGISDDPYVRHIV